jgi:dTDP-4-dehydrorhamnose 3,5-epimerase
MIFHKTNLQSVLILEMDLRHDHRGWFSEGWNTKSANLRVDQVNFSTSLLKGTFRGLHYQEDPHGQIKVVFCVRGKVEDVVVDVRKDSPTYLKSVKVELEPDNGRAVFIPKGFAHGWLALEPRSEIVYLVEGVWNQESERGLRYDDPAIDLSFPMPVKVISSRDANWPLVSP